MTVLTKNVYIIGGGMEEKLVEKSIQYFVERSDYYYEPTPVQEEFQRGQNPICDTDHGERTNHKLKDQPFYQRGRNGKMRNY